MEAFELKERTKLKVKIYGDEFDICRPRVSEHREILAKVKASSDPIEVSEAWISFLAGLGIPRDVTEGMEPEHMNQLIDFVCGVKKSQAKNG